MRNNLNNVTEDYDKDGATAAALRRLDDEDESTEIQIDEHMTNDDAWSTSRSLHGVSTPGADGEDVNEWGDEMSEFQKHGIRLKPYRPKEGEPAPAVQLLSQRINA